MNTAAISSETLCPEGGGARKAGGNSAARFRFPTGNTLHIEEVLTVRLTAQELDKMQSVNIGAVEADKLADVSGLAFDSKLPMEERLARFLTRADNPYCFCVGGVGGQD